MNLPVAQQYKECIDIATYQLRGGFPVSFIGMMDCGVDYLFGLLSRDTDISKKYFVLPLNLMETDGVDEKIIQILRQSITYATGLNCTAQNYDEVWLALSDAMKKKPIIFLFYFGFKQKYSSFFFEQFLNWRFMASTTLNWIVCATYGCLHSTNSYAIEKIIKTHIVPVLPHNKESVLTVIDNFQSRLGSTEKSSHPKLVALSGGNPGVLKALYILVMHNKLEEMRSDESLRSRLNLIAEELTQKERNILMGLEADVDIENRLTHFGYLTEAKIFSPIFEEYLQTQYGSLPSGLTIQQEKILKLLIAHAPHPIHRDEIAKEIWGKLWHEKYSDWAIDQLIYSLRQNLVKSKSRHKIKTKKGKGYFVIVT